MNSDLMVLIEGSFGELAMVISFFAALILAGWAVKGFLGVLIFLGAFVLLDYGIRHAQSRIVEEISLALVLALLGWVAIWCINMKHYLIGAIIALTSFICGSVFLCALYLRLIISVPGSFNSEQQ